MFLKKLFIFTLPLVFFLDCGNSVIRHDASDSSKTNVTTHLQTENILTNKSNAISYDLQDADMISFFNNYNKPEKDIFINNASRGGNFHLVNDDKIKDDFGVTFPSKAKGKGWHWIRQYADTDPINLKWYGAKGIGLQGYKDDSAALVKAIDLIKSKGGGKLYIPASTSFYGFNGDGILLSDNTEIYGDGPSSQIKHVNPESATFYKGAIFYTTTYGPINASSIVREPFYPVQDAEKGQNYVTVSNSSDISKLVTGRIIGLGAGYFQKRNIEKKARFTQFELNEITKIDGNKVYLKYPLSVPLKTSMKAHSAATPSPVIVDVNGNHTMNKKLNVYDRITKNIYIHDLTLSQADYNMIDNKPYNASDNPSPVIALGGTFESKFDRLTIESYGTFGGNLFNRCEISNLKIFSVRKFTDLGYGSANTKMHDIVWQYKLSKIPDSSETSFVYLNDGTHDIEIYNIKASGNWNGINLFAIAGGGHDIYIHDVDINLPKFQSPKRVAIMIRDDDATTFSHDIKFQNVTISLGSVKQFIQVEGTNQVVDDKRIVFDNVIFKGRITNRQANSVTISNSPEITLNKVQIPEGNILLDNAGAAKIQDLDAPQSNIINANSKGRKLQVLKSKYRALKDD